MFLHVSAANFSHPQRATSLEDMYCMLHTLSDTNGKTFIHISVISYIYSSIIKIVLKL